MKNIFYLILIIGLLCSCEKRKELKLFKEDFKAMTGTYTGEVQILISSPSVVYDSLGRVIDFEFQVDTFYRTETVLIEGNIRDSIYTIDGLTMNWEYVKWNATGIYMETANPSPVDWHRLNLTFNERDEILSMEESHTLDGYGFRPPNSTTYIFTGNKE